MHVRCPHCHSPIELVDDAELSDIPCPSCGSSFSLVPHETLTYDARGKTIAHFELIETLGIGAFGLVWKAKDTKLDRTVAIKIPRKDQLDAQETEQFLREARAAARVGAWIEPAPTPKRTSEWSESLALFYPSSSAARGEEKSTIRRAARLEYSPRIAGLPKPQTEIELPVRETRQDVPLIFGHA